MKRADVARRSAMISLPCCLMQISRAQISEARGKRHDIPAEFHVAEL
jgi:hypothetical protein